MDNNSRRKRQGNVLSSLDVAIEVLHLAEKVSDITPAKTAFGSVGAMSEFRENLAVLVIENNFHRGFMRGCGIVVRFKMLRSSERRKHITTRFWNMFGYTA